MNIFLLMVNFCFVFIIFIVYIIKGFNLGEKNYNILIYDKNYEFFRK